MEPLIDIILPTWNNPLDFDPCLVSIYKTGVVNTQLARVIVVNNGKQPIQKQHAGCPGLTVLTPGENIGWEGALQLGLEHSKAQYVVFQNDDTLIPKCSQRFYELLLIPFQNKQVAAVGPVTTVASGIQSIYNPRCPSMQTEVNWTIFFTVMLRRAYLDEVGGVDTTLPGGDDFDLSIRFKKAGKKMMVLPDAFLLHHGFRTGTRLHGDQTVQNGWNSQEMIERTNHALIEKHGFRTFFEVYTQQVVQQVNPWADGDPEGKLIASMIEPHEKVLELGCGFRRTVPQATTLDRVPKGEPIPLLLGAPTESVADITADATKPLPFPESEFDVVVVRHLLEHCLDPLLVLSQWRQVLRDGGRLIIAVPDNEVINGIPLAPDHCHAFTADSLRRLTACAGFVMRSSQSSNNGVSFVSCFERVPIPVESVYA